MAQTAILGATRLGNFRLGYVPAATVPMRLARVRVLLGGVDIALVSSSPRTLVGSVTVHDALNDNPNTASFTVKGAAPTVGQSLRVTVGVDAPVLLFTGTVQTVDLSYVGTGTNTWACTATDDLARLNQRRPFGTWTNVSATTIAQALIATYAPGFTSVNVQAALPAISLNLDGSEGFSSALRQIATLIGGYFYVEDLDLHLFTTEASNAPDAVDATHRPQDDPPISMTTDVSQVKTRMFGKGHGEQLLADVAIGETIVPVANAESWFNPAGGKAIADTQVFSYTGVEAGGTGSMVGPGAAPSVAVTANLAAGSGVESGTHGWAYTWVTAGGESLPSPTTSLEIGVPTGPSAAPGVYATGANIPSTDLLVGDTVVYSYSWSTATSINDLTQETARSPTTTITAAHILGGAAADSPIVQGVPSTDPRVKWMRVWKTVNGGSLVLGAIYTGGGVQKGIANANAGFTIDNGAFSTAHSTATLNQAAIGGIAIGPSGTTSRKVYRTAAGAAQLKLHSTIANNTATTLTDSTADASLGANAPTADTSGLAQPTGQVNAGSTSMLLASSAPFVSGGGWVLLGSQAVRYTGISGNTLTGIPATGPGALINTVRYGEHADAPAILTGVSGIATAILGGTTVNLWVQRDDVPAQAAMAALDGTSGIYEGYVSDERRNEASLIALCDANLALFSRPMVTVTYATRDRKTKSGKSVSINLANPPIVKTLTIQDVTISEISVAATLLPKFTVTASNVRFSLENVLRQLLEKAA